MQTFLILGINIPIDYERVFTFLFNNLTYILIEFHLKNPLWNLQSNCKKNCKNNLKFITIH